MAKHKLRTPITDVHGQKVQELNLREFVTGADIVASQTSAGAAIERDYKMLASVAGLDYNDFLKLDARDIKAVDMHTAKIMSDPKESEPSTNA